MKGSTVLVTVLPVPGRAVSGIAYYAAELARKLCAVNPHYEIWANDDAAELDPCPGRVRRVWRYDRAWRDLIRQVLSQRPSLIHLQHSLFMYGAGARGAASILAFVILCRLLRVPLVVTLHDLPAIDQIDREYVRSHHYSYSAWLVRLVMRVIFGLIIFCSRRVIVHHEAFRSILVRDYRCPSERAHVIPLSPLGARVCDRVVSREMFGLSPSAFVLLFFGYAAPYKGIESILDAARALHGRERISDVEIVVAAGVQPSRENDAEYLRYYESLRATAAGIPSVRWIGYVDDKRVDELFACADLCVFPYVAFQGMSGPMTIAAEHGKPFLVSQVIARATGLPASIAFEEGGPALARGVLAYRSDPLARSSVNEVCEAFTRSQQDTDVSGLTAGVYTCAIR